jgi:hypothetical protein
MIHHAALEIRREHAADEMRFWGLLGFEAVEPPAALGERALWLERAGTQIHLFFADEPVIPASGHLAVVTPGFDDVFAALAPFAPERRAEHWGAARAFVTSPAGHRVEFMAAPPSP